MLAQALGEAPGQQFAEHGFQFGRWAFALDEDGNIREARMVPASELTDFSFDFQDLRLTPVKPDKDES